jgi:hypothetical protein
MQAVQKGRQRLQVVVDLPSEEPAADGAESTFFDQDQG